MKTHDFAKKKETRIPIKYPKIEANNIFLKSETKYFQNIMDIIYPTFKIGKTNLAEFNIILIKSILKYLNVEINLVCLSKLNIFTKKNQLLIDITKACNGDIFVSGTGAKNYISGNELLYKKNNIQLAYQNFNHPYYKQLKEPFTYKMSIVDLLFNYGEESLNILKSVQKPDYINI